MITDGELRKLAEAWRGKAARLRHNYRSTASAQSASDAALALETCAEDLEVWLASEIPLAAALKPRSYETLAERAAEQAPAQTALRPVAPGVAPHNAKAAGMTNDEW